MIEERIRELNERLVVMLTTARNMVERSVRALVEKDEDLAHQVIERDEVELNQMEIENMEETVNIIALYQPTATNLRMLVTAIVINRDMERMGDHAVNVAEFALYLIPRPQLKPLVDIPKMAEAVMRMLDDSLRSMLKGDEELAKEVILADAEVNRLDRQVLQDVIGYMGKDPASLERGTRLILISQNLERIGDLATNIAESVLYVTESKLYLHRKKDIIRELEEKGKENG
jgi:phosphate transport system protein